jgi:phosphoribosylaminoimidazole (AIR) synthetase
MARVFNLGIGMVVAVPVDDLARTLTLLRDAGHAAAEIGQLVAGGTREVRFT